MINRLSSMLASLLPTTPTTNDTTSKPTTDDDIKRSMTAANNNRLSRDVLIELFSYLTVHERVIIIPHICQPWYMAVSSDHLWRPLFQYVSQSIAPPFSTVTSSPSSQPAVDATASSSSMSYAQQYREYVKDLCRQVSQPRDYGCPFGDYTWPAIICHTPVLYHNIIHNMGWRVPLVTQRYILARLPLARNASIMMRAGSGVWSALLMWCITRIDLSATTRAPQMLLIINDSDEQKHQYQTIVQLVEPLTIVTNHDHGAVHMPNMDRICGILPDWNGTTALDRDAYDTAGREQQTREEQQLVLANLPKILICSSTQAALCPVIPTSATSSSSSSPSVSRVTSWLPSLRVCMVANNGVAAADHTTSGIRTLITALAASDHVQTIMVTTENDNVSRAVPPLLVDHDDALRMDARVWCFYPSLPSHSYRSAIAPLHRYVDCERPDWRWEALHDIVTGSPAPSPTASCVVFVTRCRSTYPSASSSSTIPTCVPSSSSVAETKDSKAAYVADDVKHDDGSVEGLAQVLLNHDHTAYHSRIGILHTDMTYDECIMAITNHGQGITRLLITNWPMTSSIHQCTITKYLAGFSSWIINYDYPSSYQQYYNRVIAQRDVSPPSSSSSSPSRGLIINLLCRRVRHGVMMTQMAANIIAAADLRHTAAILQITHDELPADFWTLLQPSSTTT